jgi:hypothetical protein
MMTFQTPFSSAGGVAKSILADASILGCEKESYSVCDRLRANSAGSS